jgi:hypothetical protein
MPVSYPGVGGLSMCADAQVSARHPGRFLARMRVRLYANLHIRVRKGLQIHFKPLYPRVALR